MNDSDAVPSDFEQDIVSVRARSDRRHLLAVERVLWRKLPREFGLHLLAPAGNQLTPWFE
jgi:hypothetical protein